MSVYSFSEVMVAIEISQPGEPDVKAILPRNYVKKFSLYWC
ncbi:protein of unknown function [Xenorhabdus doucetiae]|uniref:Uncharacterized protein n=1 Tax=Xenorhabdus doucetiae TaxID=351671 RepID=A0A068QV42_9GAMM|nr:hypothetical protein LY16_01002 [Xenorhabdus doucetiae]CDG17715.1 protein of unknown function [Xenorhabdus doucetiae]